MKFDSKSIVLNSSNRDFFSINDHAFVIDKDTNLQGHLNLIKDQNNSLIPIKELSGDKAFPFTEKLYPKGMVSHTVNVYNNHEVPVILESSRYNIIKNNLINETDLSTDYSKVLVSRLIHTNIKYEPASTIVYDKTCTNHKVQLNSSMAEVRSKAKIVIPKVSNYGNLVLTVQKDCFIELKLEDNVNDVIKLPSFLTYSSGFIKGTFTQSGRYTIVIEYSDGQQIVDIVVPYYQRLL